MAVEPMGPYAIRQFEIDVLVPINLFGFDISFTNSAQAMLTTVLVVGTLLVYGARQGATIPGRLQTGVELIYTFVEDTLIRFGGEEAKRALPLMLSIFVFILFGSMIGLTPVKFTFTSHVVVALALALTVFAYVNYLAVSRHGLGFFRLFLPTGTPLYLAPLIVIIEIFSYFFRPVTLGLRVFANIVAGHIMLKLFGDFCAMLTENFGAAGMLAAVLPLAAMIVMHAVELGVFLIQSYIFLVISSFYIRDALHAH
jgi:F-type H+-transporting ATPase subunit a